MNTYQIICGESKEVLKGFPSNHFHCIVTSPPYWQLRDYSVSNQIGMEPTFQEYISNVVDVLEEAKRVLRDDGVMWVVIGDTYSTPKKGNTQDNINSPNRRKKLHEQKIDKKIADGTKKKNLIGIPWRLVFALQDKGWILRCDVIWNKTSAMPDGAKDRPSRSHAS